MSDQESGRRCPGCGKIVDENLAQCDCGFPLHHDEESDPRSHIDAVEEMFQAHDDDDESHWDNIGDHVDDHPAEGHEGMFAGEFESGENDRQEPRPPHKNHHPVLILVILGHIAVLVAIWYVASGRFAQRNNSETVVVQQTYTEDDRDENAPPRRTEFITRAGTPARAIEERMNNAGVYCFVERFSISRGVAEITLTRSVAWDMQELRRQITEDAVTVLEAVFDESSDVKSLNLEVRFPINEETRAPWPVVFSLDVSRDQARGALREGGGAEQVIRILGGTYHERLTPD